MAVGHRVEIQSYLFRAVGSLLPAVDRVLLALLRTGVIEPVAAPIWHGLVVFLDAAEELTVQGLLEGLRGLHHLVGVGVFCAQVGEYLGMVFLPEPEVVVLAPLAMNDVDLGDSFGQRWAGNGPGHRH